MLKSVAIFVIFYSAHGVTPDAVGQKSLSVTSEAKMRRASVEASGARPQESAEGDHPEKSKQTSGESDKEDKSHASQNKDDTQHQTSNSHERNKKRESKMKKPMKSESSRPQKTNEKGSQDKKSDASDKESKPPKTSENSSKKKKSDKESKPSKTSKNGSKKEKADASDKESEPSKTSENGSQKKKGDAAGETIKPSKTSENSSKSKKSDASDETDEPSETSDKSLISAVKKLQDELSHPDSLPQSDQESGQEKQSMISAKTKASFVSLSNEPSESHDHTGEDERMSLRQLLNSRVGGKCDDKHYEACSCMMGCEVNGEDSKECSSDKSAKDQNNKVVADAMEKSKGDDKKLCDQIMCMTYCGNKMGCLDDVKEHCTDYKKAKPDCKVDCDGANPTAILSMTALFLAALMQI